MNLFAKCQIWGPTSLRNGSANLFLFFTIVLFSHSLLAVATATLPQGIYSPSFLYGQINGLEQRYTESGKLVRLTDYKAIEFNAKTLAQLNTQAQALITSLNRFGAFKLGDSLNLGTLEVQTKPEIKYVAPVLARGITKNWSVGLGVPVITYDNKVRLSESFSNIDFYRSQFSGLSAELDQAFDTNLGEATQQTLEAKGYKRLSDRHQQFVGDVQVASVFKLYEDENQALVHQAMLTLPTGPAYDPDDLLALNTFHKTSLENTLAYARQLTRFWKVVPYSSLKVVVPEQIEARVPTSENDMLPDESTKENVERTDGSTVELGLQNAFSIIEAIQLSFDYKIGVKGEDRYTGAKNSRYELLAKNSNSSWQKVSAEVIYSTVKSYLRKKSFLPMNLSLSAFDTIAGRNVERQSGQELSLTLFF